VSLQRTEVFVENGVRGGVDLAQEAGFVATSGKAELEATDPGE
jgi:hypothetical protein